MQAVLATRGLGRDYGFRPALRSFDIELNEGELVCLLGPNGAGKSTLLTTLSAPRPPDRGEILFDGDVLQTAADARRYLARVGFLGHEPGVLYDLSARENLRFFLGLFQRRRSIDDDRRIDDLLARVGLRDRANDPARSFSRGLKQRLGLCRVFLNRPRVVLLDEPLTGLDREGVRILGDLLDEHLATGGVGLLATHDDGPFFNLASRFVFIRDGRLTADIARDRYNATTRAKAEELLYGKTARTATDL